jgi:predicted metal-binding membrane protein
MWLAMAAAMMLPTAAPMIRTYAEIADTAAARGEPVVHPLVLTAGYLFVWALAATRFLRPCSWPSSADRRAFQGARSAPVKGLIAGADPGCAPALYQFSGPSSRRA